MKQSLFTEEKLTGILEQPGRLARSGREEPIKAHFNPIPQD